MTMAAYSTSEVTRILYVRHGHVPGNDADNPETYAYTGSATDISLSEKGKVQAKACAEKIAEFCEQGVIGKVAALYSSLLKRAQQTSLPISKTLGLPIQTKPDLQEIHWGEADGQLVSKMADISKANENLAKLKCPDFENRKVRWNYLPAFSRAETYNDLLRRNIFILGVIGNKHVGKTVVVVGHGRALKTLIADSLDKEAGIPYPENCGIAEFSYTRQQGLRFVGVLTDSPRITTGMGKQPPIRSKL
jgi:broad specificity phosphatase PhoE